MDRVKFFQRITRYIESGKIDKAKEECKNNLNELKVRSLYMKILINL